MSDDPEISKWLEDQKRELDELDKSAVFASLVSVPYLKSPKCMLQVGAAILTDKPIVLIVLDDTCVPKKLEKCADKIIRVKRSEMQRASDELAAWVNTEIKANKPLLN